MNRKSIIFSLVLSASGLITLPASDTQLRKNDTEQSLISELFSPQLAKAQEIAEGVAGTVDKKRRSPQVSVETKSYADKVDIILGPNVLKDDYQPYPIKFELYVNDILTESKYQAQTDRGPLVFAIPSSVAVAPFKYVVIATLLHPNRQFVTVAQGAVYQQNFFTTLPCSFTTEKTNEDGTTTPVTYTNDEVKVAQDSNSSFTLEFVGKSVADSDGESVDATISSALVYTPSSGIVSGTVTSSQDEIESALPITISGSAELGDDSKTLTSFSAQSTDGTTSLECGTTSTADSDQLNKLF